MCLGALSKKVALEFIEDPRFANAATLAKLFTDGCRLDDRLPIVRELYLACGNELKMR